MNFTSAQINPDDVEETARKFYLAMTPAIDVITGQLTDLGEARFYSLLIGALSGRLAAHIGKDNAADALESGAARIRAYLPGQPAPEATH